MLAVTKKETPINHSSLLNKTQTPFFALCVSLLFVQVTAWTGKGVYPSNTEQVQ